MCKYSIIWLWFCADVKFDFFMFCWLCIPI